MPPHPDHRHDDSLADQPVSGLSSSESRDPANERTDDWTGLCVDSSMPEVEAACDQIRPAASVEREHSQSLRSKLVLTLALMLGVVVGIDEFVRQKVIAPEFANLERVAALKDTNRVLSAINTEVEFLAETAALDASRIGEQYQSGLGADVIRSDPQSLQHVLRAVGQRVQWAAIVHRGGQWNWLAEPDGGDQQTTFPGILERIANNLAEQASEQPTEQRGMTSGSDGKLYLFAALPIPCPADGELDETAGFCGDFYVVGRRFDGAAMSELQLRTSVPFSIQAYPPGSTIQKSIGIEPTDKSLLCVVWPLLNPAGTPLAKLVVQLPREVTSRSSRTTAFARYLSLCGACASLLLLLLLLQRIVIGRLETIREHTERIAQSGIISEESSLPVLHVAGHDEIGQLAKSIDRMRTRLGDAQRRLSDASHAAGMSLVADTVIHNVGNVLTNVNSLIETATRRVDSLRIEPLEKLADRLRSEEVDEALRQATPDYLQRLSETLEDDKDDLAALLQTLNDNVQHIHQVIRDQRRHANQPVKWVQLDLRKVVEEAVKCSHARLSKDNVRVEFQCDVDTRIWTDRSLLLQILINVIGNAGNATRDIKNRQPTLDIDVVCTKTSAHIRFRDNGCGMDRGTLSRVFDAHFTTRQSGSGLGLHFCAIAIKRIGGVIRAESDGPDRGATFVIELPISKPTATNQTTASNQPATNYGTGRSPEDQVMQTEIDRSPSLAGSESSLGEDR